MKNTNLLELYQFSSKPQFIKFTTHDVLFYIVLRIYNQNTTKHCKITS